MVSGEFLWSWSISGKGEFYIIMVPCDIATRPSFYELQGANILKLFCNAVVFTVQAAALISCK